MTRPKTRRRAPARVPRYLNHAKSGQAYCYVYADDGHRKQVYLGVYDSPLSWREFHRIAALALSPSGVSTELLKPSAEGSADPANPPVFAMVSQFLKWSKKRHRRADGTPTGQTDNYRYAARSLLKLYRDLPVREFTVVHLRQIRVDMEQAKRADGRESALSRKTINSRINLIRKIFKKGVAEFGFECPGQPMLAALSGLLPSETDNRESDGVPAVDPELVVATLEHTPPNVSAMIRLQDLTGMRPGEVVQMSSAEIDRSGAVWIYAPAQHKNAWRNSKKYDRRIELHADAQAILAPFLLRRPNAALFSAKEDSEWLRDERRTRSLERREKKDLTANRARDEARRRNPKKKLLDHYTTRSYGEAVERARARGEVAHWTPNEIRHRTLTDVAHKHGKATASAVGGHADDRSVDRYVEPDLKSASAALADRRAL